MFDNAFKDFDKSFVGFDKMFKQFAATTEQVAKATNYPPYNIKKIDDNKYVIEMAVAGFGRQDLEVELLDNKLSIKGNTQAGEPSEVDSTGTLTFPQVIYQGLAMRPFTRTFTLSDTLEIQGAEMFNGILKIVLEAIIPEHKKPQKININDKETSAPSTAEYLAERKEK